jgi:predicted ABC-type transport system involved in lysophospholipase L1 biosynthesis ATPase subunit
VLFRSQLLIRLEQIHKSYAFGKGGAVPVLRGVDLILPTEGTMAICGASGSGGALSFADTTGGTASGGFSLSGDVPRYTARIRAGEWGDSADK